MDLNNNILLVILVSANNYQDCMSYPHLRTQYIKDRTIDKRGNYQINSNQVLSNVLSSQFRCLKSHAIGQLSPKTHQFNDNVIRENRLVLKNVTESQVTQAVVRRRLWVVRLGPTFCQDWVLSAGMSYQDRPAQPYRGPSVLRRRIHYIPLI